MEIQAYEVEIADFVLCLVFKKDGCVSDYTTNLKHLCDSCCQTLF